MSASKLVDIPINITPKGKFNLICYYYLYFICLALRPQSHLKLSDDVVQDGGHCQISEVSHGFKLRLRLSKGCIYSFRRQEKKLNHKSIKLYCR